MLSNSSRRYAVRGFSLAELLITLAIMGILMAFTVPPLLQAQGSSQSSKYTAMAKDTVFMVLAAYEQYRLANPTVATTVGFGALTPYMNYVKTDSSSTLDTTSASSMTCGSGNRGCLALHNGAYLYYGTNVTFGGTSTTNGFWMGLDPDGTRNNNPSLGMVLTYDGRIKSYGNVDATYYYITGGVSGSVAPGSTDASWFSGF